MDEGAILSSSAPQQYFAAMAAASTLFLRRGSSSSSSSSRRILTALVPVDEDSMVEAVVPPSNLHSLTSAEMILWYCLVAAFVVPFVVCALYFMYHNHRSHRRALQAMAENQALDEQQEAEEADFATMQRNVKAWSALEKQRMTRIVRSSVRANAKRLSPEELRRRSSSIDSTSKDSVCGICLEELGPKCVGSSNPHCMHLYHEECIVSWLAPRQHWLCPICRQVFLLNPSLQSSTAATVTGTCPSTTDHMSTTAFSEQDDSLTIPTSGEEDVGEHPFPHSIQDPIEEEEIESTDDSAIGDAVPQDSRSAGTTSITDDEEDYDDVDASAQCSNNTVPL